jgi:squalene synthase HpnC
MSEAEALASGKGHRDENFPVASVLIRRRHRPAILAYYRFARAADDVADHPTAAPDEKLKILDAMRRTLLGQADLSPEASALRRVLAERNLTAQHGEDLLEAFRRDVTKLRYENWDALMDYCRYSAMPVGRYVLDVHGEDRATWGPSDALCAALQVINHLQDCAKDYRGLGRIYLPQSMMEAAGVTPAALGAPRASPGLLGIIAALARKTDDLLQRARPLAGQTRDTRLGLEISVIHRLAEDLNRGLLTRDPLSMPVHHTKPRALRLALGAGAGFLGRRLRFGKPPARATIRS